MMRYEIINSLISKYGYKSYLEIGIQGGWCLCQINCESKVGVDPSPQINEFPKTEMHLKTSDAFFQDYQGTFDIIFIDGLHHSDQAFRDFENALSRLNEGGTIVFHDCNPEEYKFQIVPMPVDAWTWTGDVWRAFVKARRKNSKYHSFVVDTDYGVGVIQPFKESECNLDDLTISDEHLTWEYFSQNRGYLLNLIPVSKLGAYL